MYDEHVLCLVDDEKHDGCYLNGEAENDDGKCMLMLVKI